MRPQSWLARAEPRLPARATATSRGLKWLCATPDSPTRAPVPPPSAVVRDAIGPFEIDIRHEWCKGCDICSRVCPEYCLDVDVDGVLRIVDGDSCTGCRLCEILCPDFAIAIHPAVKAVTSESGMR